MTLMELVSLARLRAAEKGLGSRDVTFVSSNNLPTADIKDITYCEGCKEFHIVMER